MITLPEMIALLSQAVATFPDKRTGKNTQYTLQDAALGAFSVFFTQSPSFLAHQKVMQEELGLNNAHSLFGLIDIPTDNQIRDLLDKVPVDKVFPVFTEIFNHLSQEGLLDQFRVSGVDMDDKDKLKMPEGLGSDLGQLLVALDGTQYFSSGKIHCGKCSTKEHKTGEITYSHGFITPAIVSPDNPYVIPLIPEYITPQDGEVKQDFEIKAAKRWLRSYGASLSSLGVTILGDDLYAHEPFVRLLLSTGFNFILVCKPDSHKSLYEWIKGITQTYQTTSWTGKFHEVTTYTYASEVPLKTPGIKEDHPLLLNFVEVEVVQQETGKILYHNGFVTNHQITEDTVEDIVSAGRARWKIENEQINTLKTKGYHLEHNFGHGRENLSQLLSSYALLSYLIHTVMDLTDNLYHSLRVRLGSREAFFNAIKNLTIFMYFRDWSHLFNFMIEGLKRRHLAPG